MDGSMVESKRMWEHILFKNTQLAIQAFERMWSEACKPGGRDSLMRFQKLCQDVKTWSDHMMREHANLITSKCDYFRDLVACAITANAKVLCIIKLRKNPEKVNVPVPTNEMFLHTMMTNMAENLYNEPWIMQDKDQFNRRKVLKDILREALHDAIDQHLPKREILVANIGTGIEELEETEAPDEPLDDVDAFEDPGPVGEGGDEPTNEAIPSEDGDEEGGEVKTIEDPTAPPLPSAVPPSPSPSPSSAPASHQPDDEQLFPGAQSHENFNE